MLAILVERDHAHGGVDADEYINDGFGWTVKRERERESFLCGLSEERRDSKKEHPFLLLWIYFFVRNS